MKKDIKKSYGVALCGMLCALALALSAVEGLIPALPFMPPGAKPGLSNIITMFAASVLGLHYALIVAGVKAVFVLATSGPTAAFMSAAGGVLSVLCMWAAYRLRGGKTGFVGIGIIGGVTHNVGQLGGAMLLTGTVRLYMYLPALILFGVAAGAVTGVILSVTMPALIKVIPRR